MAHRIPSPTLPEAVVITGIGMVTPLGLKPAEVLGRIEAGTGAAAPPEHFDASPFACPVCAVVEDFRPRDFIAEVKMIRLMNRDAQLAVAAAHLALQDAQIQIGTSHAPEEIGLFGATGLAGLPVQEIAPLLKTSTDAEGRFDLTRFGESGLRSVSPILSFKILSNMPVCFVSICENIQGANAVYTPWEGQGARAIAAGILALQGGDARCVLVGASDVKTHDLAFLTLEEMGLFHSWRGSGKGLAPGEGSVFLVLEQESEARRRSTNIYARIARWNFHFQDGPPEAGVFEATMEGLHDGQLGAIIAAANGDPAQDQAESQALAKMNLLAPRTLSPKEHAGDLFAAAAPLQVAMAALTAQCLGGSVLANCFGHGNELAAFLLEPS
jgi:3-oxoacyl-[acyl-carrier-protein] synthase II